MRRIRCTAVMECGTCDDDDDDDDDGEVAMAIRTQELRKEANGPLRGGGGTCARVKSRR